MTSGQVAEGELKVSKSLEVVKVTRNEISTIDSERKRTGSGSKVGSVSLKQREQH